MDKEVIITATTANERDEIQVTKDRNNLMVKTKSGRPMGGIQIWDVTGRKIYLDSKASD